MVVADHYWEHCYRQWQELITTGNVTVNCSSWSLLRTWSQTMVVVDHYWERCHRHLYFLKFASSEEVCVGGPKLNYHTPGLAVVCVWGPIWDVHWTFLLICFEKLVLCSRNSKWDISLRQKTWKMHWNKCRHFVQLRLKTYWSIEKTDSRKNTIFTVAGICSTTDFVAVRSWDTV